MHPNRTRRHSLLTAKSFTIAMVLVNAAGLVLVQQKMKGAQVDDAYALDDGAQRVASIRPAEIPERRLLAEIELSAAPPSRPYVELPVLQQLPAPRIDLELADLEPPAVPARVRHASRAAGPSLAVAEPAPIAAREVVAEPEVRLVSIHRIPTPVTARASPTARPILIDALPPVPQPAVAAPTTAPFVAVDGVTGTLGSGPASAREHGATAAFRVRSSDDSSSTQRSFEIAPTAPQIGAPVVSAEDGPARSKTLTAPTPAELPPLEPTPPAAEPVEQSPAAA